MPELPEVYTIVQGLNRKIKGKTIKNVIVRNSYLLKNISARDFEKRLKNKKFLSIHRIGKNIIFHFNDGQRMLLHLKMTGRLQYGDTPLDNDKNKHLHLIFDLNNAKKLLFFDIRKFAKVLLVNEDKEQLLKENLGPDALDISEKEFIQRVGSKKSAIKKVLLDQSVLAGVGNIYSDDMLWYAKINPQKIASKLSQKELKKLYRAMNVILQKSIHVGGSTVKDYKDIVGKIGKYYSHYRLVYDRKGELCSRCKTPIKKVTIGGRSCCYCQSCQKIESRK